MEIEFKVTKHAKNRFEVSGMISRHRAPLSEPYSRVFTTRKAAQADADRWTRIETREAQERKEWREVRLRHAQDYLAKRAARVKVEQFALDV